MKISNRHFRRWFIASWSSFALFAILVYAFRLYAHAPFLGPLGYATMIGLLLAALANSDRRTHYLLVSGSLMAFGAMASFDLVSSKDELIALWRDWLGKDITEQQANGFAQSLSILISIFCGSLASASLFFGLNRRNFAAQPRKEAPPK